MKTNADVREMLLDRMLEIDPLMLIDDIDEKIKEISKWLREFNLDIRHLHFNQ